MDDLNQFLIKLEQADDETALLCKLFEWLRPEDPTQVNTFEEKVERLGKTMEANPKTSELIRERLQKFFVNLRFLPLYSVVGILPRRTFSEEFIFRIYNRVLPRPPLVFNAASLLDRLFPHRDDGDWVKAVPDQAWIRLYRLFIPNQTDPNVDVHLTDEALYALEMLSIWVAAEEMEDELLRLDPTLAEHNSCFIALKREIAKFVTAYRSKFDPAVKEQQTEAAHAQILLKQCFEQLQEFRQRALSIGNDLKLTYLLERLEQTLSRIRDLLDILDQEDLITTRGKSLGLFRKLVGYLYSERSVTSLIRQNSFLLSKSVTNHASKTGEHYVTENRREYLGMLGMGLGAGVFIAFMGLIKILIGSTNLSMEWKTLWICLNYGLGFAIIHIFHFTVATKQPAMTAAYIARKLENANDGAVDRKVLAQLFMKVGRSQFAAIAGNVGGALPVALIIGLAAGPLAGIELLAPNRATSLMQEQNPIASPALFYAAIAGIWLFVSGLVAGYVDNRCLYLNFPNRIRLHPLLERFLSYQQRDRIANYIGEHSGALWGNFFFGVMLGVTGYVGYLLGLPLDIRHVAFSVANVGFSSAEAWPGMGIFTLFVFYALLIGVVNLVVSFLLALVVAIRSRGLRLGKISTLTNALLKEVRNRPWELFLPPTTSTEKGH